MEKVETNRQKKSKKDKKKSQPRKKPTLFAKIDKALSNETFRFVMGLFFSLVSLLSLVSIISFLFTWADDQSLIGDSMITESIARNQVGRLGHRWANLLVCELFGLGAFIVPLFFAGVACICFRKKLRFSFFRMLVLSLSGAVLFSAIFSFIFSFTPAKHIFGEGAGGAYGYYINEEMVKALGYVGTAAILLFLLILWLILFNTAFVDRIKAFMDFINDKIASGRKHADAGGDEDLPEGVDNGDPDAQEGEEGDGEGDDDEDEDEGDEEEDEDDEEDDGEHDGGDDRMPQFDIIGGENIPEKREDPPVDVIPPAPTDNGKDWEARYDPRLSLSHYRMPDTSLLKDYPSNLDVTREELEKNNKKIVNTLKDYKIGVSKISARIGPTVTLYEVVPAPGVRVSQIKRLEEDIAISLAALGVRVVTIPGSNAVGIEVANEKQTIVSMKSLLNDPKFKECQYDLPVVIGRTISNEAKFFDLAKMPHLLVAGATGQGKSVGLNTIIASLIFRKHPSELKFVLVDPKKVELSLYAPLEKHYLAKLPDAEEPIITNTKSVVYTLKSLCILMDRRYDLLKAASVRDIKSYNEKFLSRKLNPLNGHEFMPYIVVIIDEFADLLITAGRDVEEPIARLAQLARAVGIHLVIATQRPTTNIITGTIKANFPARIAFKVISGVDSKTILDQTGANRLVGRGDMLISTSSSEPVRVQCAFIDTCEVEDLTKYVSSQQGFGSAFLLPEYDGEDNSGGGISKGPGSGEVDELFKEAARLIVREQVGSTSLIQRKMNLGYPRAGKIMDQLENYGIVGPSEGSKPRQVRVTSLEMLEDLLDTI
ncbi:MAG: DNA translocase FtsK 4TM domain-containing protein [Candidatus Coprenecus sp.]